MKKAVIGLGILLLLAIAALFSLRQEKKEPLAALRFVGYGVDTNGVNIAQLAFTNSIDRPIHYFSAKLNDPSTIGYTLGQATAVRGAFNSLTNTLGKTGASSRIDPHQELSFQIKVPTNSDLVVTVPYFVERDMPSRLVHDIRRALSMDGAMVASNAMVYLPPPAK